MPNVKETRIYLEGFRKDDLKIDMILFKEDGPVATVKDTRTNEFMTREVAYVKAQDGEWDVGLR